MDEDWMPVPCSACGKIIDLNDCIFPDRDDNTYGICKECDEERTDE